MIHTWISKESFIAQFLACLFLVEPWWDIDCLKTFQVYINMYKNYIIDVIFHFSFNLNQQKIKKIHQKRVGWSLDLLIITPLRRVSGCFDLGVFQTAHCDLFRSVDTEPLTLWTWSDMGIYRIPIFLVAVALNINGWLGVVTITLLLGILTPFVTFVRAHLTLEVGGSLGEAVVDEMIIYIIKITQFGSKFWVIKIRNGNVPPEPFGLRWDLYWTSFWDWY